MRELKFRAWDNDRKKYCTDKLHMYLTIDGKPHNFQNGGMDDVYTIEQYTGLHYKNGKEIFEGDIVSMGTELDGSDIVGKIVYGGFWNHAAFGIETKHPIPPNEKDVSWDTLTPEWCKILIKLGTMSENPELYK